VICKHFLHLNLVAQKVQPLAELKDEPRDYVLTTGFFTSVILSLKDVMKELVETARSAASS
jgi:hypothetical protein